MFTSFFNRANNYPKFDFFGEKKTFLFFRLYGQKTEIIEVLPNNHLGGSNQKSCSF